MGAFTGTWTNATNSRSITVTNTGNAFNISGSGTRTISLGNGTYTLSSNTAPVFNAVTTTGLTFNANNSVIQFTGTGTRTLSSGNLTYATIVFGATTTGSGVIGCGSGCTINTLTVDPTNYIQFTAGQTTSIPGGLTLVGTTGNQIGFVSDTRGTAATIALGTDSQATYTAFRDITFTTSSMTSTNSFNLGNNTGNTITPPAGGSGGGGIIGG